MSVKAGSIVQAGRNILLDRIQTGGPGQISVPEEKVYELGNNQTVGLVLDIPDVTYSLESFDASCQLEAMLCGSNANTDPVGTVYDLATCQPFDVVGQFNGGAGVAAPFDTIGSALAPYLMVDSLDYKFDLSGNGSITGSLRGDAIYYNKGSMYVDALGGPGPVYVVTNKALNTNVATLTIGTHTLIVGNTVTIAGVDATFNGSYAITAVTATTISYALTAANVASVAATGTVTGPQPATLVSATPYALQHLCYPYNGDIVNGVRYLLNVSDSTGQRYRYNVDYTETVTGAGASKTVTITLTGNTLPGAGNTLYVAYASDTVATYLQAVHAVDSATRPSAIRGRHVVLKVGGVIWTDVQSTNASWKVSLDPDKELGNDAVVHRDYMVADVSGAIQSKPRTVSALFTKLKAITGVATTTEVMGALQRATLTVDLILYSPTDGSVLKTVYCPDARVSLPGFSGKVQSKTLIDMSWTSISGTLLVYKGLRPGA